LIRNTNTKKRLGEEEKKKDWNTGQDSVSLQTRKIEVSWNGDVTRAEGKHRPATGTTDRRGEQAAATARRKQERDGDGDKMETRWRQDGYQNPLVHSPCGLIAEQPEQSPWSQEVLTRSRSSRKSGVAIP